MASRSKASTPADGNISSPPPQSVQQADSSCSFATAASEMPRFGSDKFTSQKFDLPLRLDKHKSPTEQVARASEDVSEHGNRIELDDDDERTDIFATDKRHESRCMNQDNPSTPEKRELDEPSPGTLSPLTVRSRGRSPGTPTRSPSPGFEQACLKAVIRARETLRNHPSARRTLSENEKAVVEIMNNMKWPKKIGKGIVYVLRHRDLKLVKIGSTKDLKGRLNKLRSECKISTASLQIVYGNNSDGLYAFEQLERLVHADLAPHRRCFQCECRSGSKKGYTEHNEWFDIADEVALQTVQLWRKFVLQDPYGEPILNASIPLKAPWPERLDMRPAVSDDERIGSHEMRIARWEGLFKLPLVQAAIPVVQAVVDEPLIVNSMLAEQGENSDATETPETPGIKVKIEPTESASQPLTGIPAFPDGSPIPSIEVSSPQTSSSEDAAASSEAEDDFNTYSPVQPRSRHARSSSTPLRVHHVSVSAQQQRCPAMYGTVQDYDVDELEASPGPSHPEPQTAPQKDSSYTTRSTNPQYFHDGRKGVADLETHNTGHEKQPNTDAFSTLSREAQSVDFIAMLHAFLKQTRPGLAPRSAYDDLLQLRWTLACLAALALHAPYVPPALSMITWAVFIPFFVGEMRGWF